ncbi:MAG: DAK2 domain-containing protein [Thermoleophilaceae bacterium]|nr:DAK2 domain-containing protein [Thermoleophilaceae bacterium]
MSDLSLVRFRHIVAAGYAELESRRQEINDLNVFPVADGDTGDNMAMTLRAVLEELDGLQNRDIDEIGRDEVVHAVARAALLGARGNSGVILSQIVRGAAEELVSRPGELVDPVLVSAALARAADAAYDSVRDPAEGTMLSAVRAMAHRVARDLAHMDRQRLEPDFDPAEQDALLASVLAGALEAGTEAVERGPEQLAVLREAGVVDAGAYGLTVIIAGVLGALRGEETPPLEHRAAPGAESLHLPQHESSDYRYCTNFAVTGTELSATALVPQLERLGDCVLVVGDDQTLRVHLHTDQPDAAAQLFGEEGEVSHFDVADMREQVAARRARLAGDATDQPDGAFCRVVAVSGGEGLVGLYEDLGALVLDGGPTLNPSTVELLAAIHSADAPEVLVLPGSPNVVMAAERAAELSEKVVRVAAVTTQQGGLAALVAFDPAVSAEENCRAITKAAAAVLTGGVAQAARDDREGRFNAGDALGYVSDELVAWGEPSDTLRATLAAMADRRELITCVAGDRPPLDHDGVLALVPEPLKLDYHRGDQPAWWWLLAAE